jgi:hypothetical protein
MPTPATSDNKFPIAADAIVVMPRTRPSLTSIVSPAMIMIALSINPNPTKGTPAANAVEMSCFLRADKACDSGFGSARELHAPCKGAWDIATSLRRSAQHAAGARVYAFCYLVGGSFLVPSLSLTATERENQTAQALEMVLWRDRDEADLGDGRGADLPNHSSWWARPQWLAPEEAAQIRWRDEREGGNRRKASNSHLLMTPSASRSILEKHPSVTLTPSFCPCKSRVGQPGGIFVRRPGGYS